jgi:phosphatidate phosphatase LPIN
MKLADGGEAFFLFETTENIAPSFQTSPLASPVVSPRPGPAEAPPSIELDEPEPFDLGNSTRRSTLESAEDDAIPRPRAVSGDWNGRPSLPIDLPRSATDDVLPSVRDSLAQRFEKSQSQPPEDHKYIEMANRGRSDSPPPVSKAEAMTRAINLSKKLFSANVPTQINESGDLMLDMTGYKTTTEEALEVELMARKVLQEELEGAYDIGSLIGVDENGNIWIYSSEEAKEAADRKSSTLQSLNPAALRSTDAVSDPGYQSDDGRSETASEDAKAEMHIRRDSDSAVGLSTAPGSPQTPTSSGDGTVSWAKTIRLNPDQLKSLGLKPGLNAASFTVNKATCQANIYLWQHKVPIVISDIDGTITKSDALGHVLNAVGRDWTHLGVAKLYTDIAANGYNILYLTSRSIGQADTTRNYLSGIVQDGYRLPKGPVILSPDRTIAALRREVIIKKPEIFKMGCLRDIRELYYPDRSASDEGHGKTPFYAGFGNRLNDALSYRSVSIPATRIFTINSYAEVSLHLLTLNSYRTSYVSMRELVDHYFPPVGTLVKEGGEEYTDFNYWRDRTLDVDEFSASESGSEYDEDYDYRGSLDETSLRSEDEGDEDVGDMEASYFSRESIDDIGNMEDSIMESVEGGPSVQNSILMDQNGNRFIAEPMDNEDIDEGEVETPGAPVEGLERRVRSLGFAVEKTPMAPPRDPKDDLKELAKVLSTPEREHVETTRVV